MRTAEAIFKQAGLKSTSSRLRVVEVLLDSAFPLTHTELLKQLPDTFDRVTLYRVLDWLLKQGIAHRIAGDDRAWRFQLNIGAQQTTRYKPATSDSALFKTHEHAHFECTRCGKIFCLENIEPKLTDSIPASFKVDSIALNIKGKCAAC